MATEEVIVGDTPIQITDGTNYALVSVIDNYGINFADSDVVPDIQRGDFLRDKMCIGPPLKIWVWNNTSRAIRIAVTKWK